MRVIIAIAICVFTCSGVFAAPATQPIAEAEEAGEKLKADAPQWAREWFDWATLERQRQHVANKNSLVDAMKLVEQIRTADIRKSSGTADGKVPGKRMCFDTAENKKKALEAAGNEVNRLKTVAAHPPTLGELPDPPSATQFKVGAVIPSQQAKVIAATADEAELLLSLITLVTVQNPPAPPHLEERRGESKAVKVRGIDARGQSTGDTFKLGKPFVITGVDPASNLFVAEPFEPMKWVE